MRPLKKNCQTLLVSRIIQHAGKNRRAALSLNKVDTL